jgi:lactate dehydrogenase-like 2-hydroxyacid dehydrogenase
MKKKFKIGIIGFGNIGKKRFLSMGLLLHRRREER